MYVRTYGWTTCAKTMIPTGRGSGAGEWINIFLDHNIILADHKQKDLLLDHMTLPAVN